MLVASCDKGSTAENLEHAEFAIERQDYSSAKGICDNLREEQNNAESMDAVTLCSLSILYMKLSEDADREDNIGMARQCYLDAYAADSAGARDFYDRNVGRGSASPLIAVVNSKVYHRDIVGDS